MRTTVAGLLAGCWLSVSIAQEDAVLITATRFAEQARRLPASVTVLGEDELRESAARTLPELLSGEAGLTMKDFYGNNAAVTSVDLRGYGITAPQNTLILLDGRRLNDFDLSGVQWSSIPLASIERIEIVRGSGAVLYGDNASAGMVNIVTRSPLAQGRSLEAFGRAARYRTREGQLYAGSGNERFGVNGSLYGYRSDGYRENNRNEQENSSLNLRWALGAGTLDLRFGTDRQDLRLPGGRFVQPSIGLDEYAADPRGSGTPLDWSSRDGVRAGASLVQPLGEAELSVGLDWRDKQLVSYFDQAGFPSTREDRLELASLTPRVRWPLGRHTLVVGADWHAWRYRSRRTDRPENLEQPNNRVTVAQDTAGFYLHDTVEITRATLATLGWRAERARYEGEDVVDPAAPGCFFCLAAPRAEETQKQRAWELGLRHALSPRWSAFARAGRSFRFANAEEIYESDAFFAPQFQLLRPQRARTREAGLEWRAGARSARATLFRSDVRDEIHLDPFTTGVGNTNLPPSRRQGVELDAAFQAASNVKLDVAYAYTEAKFLQGTLPGSAFAIGTDLALAGKTVPLVPRHKLNLAAAWDFAARTRLSAALTALSEQVLDNDEPNTLEHRIPSYYVLDVKLGREFSWGRLAATVNNLLGEDYYTYAARSAFTADRYVVYPLPGRTLGVSLEVLL